MGGLVMGGMAGPGAIGVKPGDERPSGGPADEQARASLSAGNGKTRFVAIDRKAS